MKLIVGLGNPGREYRETRHNVGFLVVDELARRHSLSWDASPAQLPDAMLAKKYGAGSWMLVRPLTFMNRSGEAVAGLARYFGVDPPDILVVVDEVSALLVPRRAPAGIPKDHPLRVEVDQENILKAAMDRFINKIIAEMRFVGIRLILSNQVANNSTGIGPSVKAKIGHKILVGPNPSKQARTQAFNDEATVPQVPDSIRSDAAAAKGTGVAELDGSSPFVFKGFYASSEDYRAALLALGVSTTIQPEPTARQIAQHTDSLRIDTDDATDRARGRAGRSGRPDPIDPDAEPVYDDSGRPLRGAAAANARSSRLATRG